MDDARKTWRDIANGEFSGPTNQHAVMGKFYAESFAKTIYNADSTGSMRWHAFSRRRR
jgi:hypothetical protein